MEKQSQNIRNFCIISHIDAGKSTLADRLLEMTGTIEQRKMREQFLDMMDLEREKGITIKLQPVRMNYTLKDKSYILNLIDTPGHVDFTYEVSRSLAAVEGAVLLVDASQGIQAQTLTNLHLAQEQNLVIIPVINKIDLNQAQTEEAAQEISQLLKINQEDILRISAKQGTNVEKVLEAVIEKIPRPAGGLADNLKSPLRALIFDSNYDTYKGAIAYIRIVDGQIKRGDKIIMLASRASVEAIEVGVFKPQMTKTDCLKTGEIGYLATGLKDVRQCRVGDTITSVIASERSERGNPVESHGITEPVPNEAKNLPTAPRNDKRKMAPLNGKKIQPLPGYQEPKPMVFASFYPAQADDYNLLKDGLAKLKLNDASLQYEPESSQGLGRGFRCGFLGMLHLEIISERLKREHKLSLVVTSPSVSYRVTIKSSNVQHQLAKQKGVEQEKYLIISSPADLPETNKIKEIEEPWLSLEIITPNQYLGQAMKLLSKTRGKYQDTQYLSPERVLLKYQAPLNEIIVDFYDQLKNITAGYASMSYQIAGYQSANLVKLDVLVAGEKIEAFSRIVHQKKAYGEARNLVDKLKELIPRHQFTIPLQVVVNDRIIARQTIRALKKNVIAGLYGGDYTRKSKLLEKQKKGKKRLKEFGRVNIPQEIFLKILKK
jgi:GTP-binding protein LepA